MNGPLDFWRRESPWTRSLDRLFEDWTSSKALQRGTNPALNFNPSCEVSENKSHYLMKFDLPGMTKEQIKVDLHDGYLTVSGERKEERKQDDQRAHLTEVFYGSFSRSFSFPTPVDAEKVLARYENGVLAIEVPKMASPTSRQISIK